MKKFLFGLAPLLAVAAFAVVPSAASAVACESQVLCNASGINLRDDLNEPPAGGNFGTDALAVNTQGPLRLCEAVGCAGVTNKNPVNDAFFGIKLHENRAFPKTKEQEEECKEAAGRAAEAFGWVEWADFQNATNSSGTSSSVFAGTSPGSNGPWSLSVRSNKCTTKPGRVSIDRFAVYLTVPKWWVTTPSTGEIEGKYIQPGSVCAGGGVELNLEQKLEINDELKTVQIDNGSGAKAILCFVSAGNYLYPTTAPTWGPFTGAIWKD